MPHRQVLKALLCSVFVLEAIGDVPGLELPPGHAGVGVRSGVLEGLLAHAVPSGSRELVVPLQQRRVVVFVARQSSVEQRAVRVIARLAIRFCAEIGEAGDVIPFRQREFGEGAADDQGQIKEYGREYMHFRDLRQANLSVVLCGVSMVVATRCCTDLRSREYSRSG